MTIAVSLWNLSNRNEEIRLFAFQDEPEFRTTGGLADLRHHEVLGFLERAGLTEEDAQQLLGDVLRQPPRVRRPRFRLSPERLARLRDFAPELITAL
jgi:hypothetical protein